MMRHFRIVSILLVVVLLAACGGAQQSTSPTAQPEQANEIADAAPFDLTRVDEQGAVIVTVTPLNLDEPGQTLDFEVSLETHSVELDMDLTRLATLATNTGLSVQPAAWEGPRGGHHVSGKLSFPTSDASSPILKSATELILTLRDVDAPERVFKWEFAQ